LFVGLYGDIGDRLQIGEGHGKNPAINNIEIETEEIKMKQGVIAI
jgi:hypothetical protein